MHDSVLARARSALHARHDRGEVIQTRGAGRLFAGDFSPSATVGEEFGGSVLGLGVMPDLDGEIVSLAGRTWRVPADGIPVEVSPNEGVAFGIAAHGGREHRVPLGPGLDMAGITSAIDDYLCATHADPDKVVCAVMIRGTFSDVVLRTVAPPTRSHETLGEVIDDETRFSFPAWSGTLVGFRFPDDTDGELIPGLHLHGIGADHGSGGHVRNATTEDVSASVWVDEIHPILGASELAAAGDVTPDYTRYEGPAT